MRKSTRLIWLTRRRKEKARELPATLCYKKAEVCSSATRVVRQYDKGVCGEIAG